jgi:GT2 family glycosyltransferase
MITIGMSIYDSVKVDTMSCLFRAISELGKQTKVRIEILKGFYVHNYREEIVQRALTNGATHVMFIDSDMTFLPDAIPTLLSRRKDIIGAPYVMKTPPHHNIVKQLVDGQIKGWGYEMPAGPFKCLSVGTGFMLVDTEVFKRTEPPYFRIEQEGSVMIGEDVAFCRRVAEAGFETWCDPTVPIGHIGEFTFMMPTIEQAQ